MMGWPVAFGFLFGGVLDYFVPQEYISKHLAGKTKRTIFYSVGLGFLMSACSHGVLAVSMELHKKGASGPAVVTFLLATPWTSLPITFLLIGFFHWKSLLIIGGALLTATLTGLILQILDRKGMIESNRHSIAVSEDFSIAKDIARRFRGYRLSLSRILKDLLGIAKGIAMLADMVLWWILLGAIMASIAAAYVPHHVFEHFFGPSVLGLAMTMALATVLEVCSEGTAPLAFEIYRQSSAFGNVFAFLMGGVVTDYTEIGLVWINLGRRTALWMVALTLPQVFLFGWLFNRFF